MSNYFSDFNAAWMASFASLSAAVMIGCTEICGGPLEDPAPELAAAAALLVIGVGNGRALAVGIFFGRGALLMCCALARASALGGRVGVKERGGLSLARAWKGSTGPLR